MQRMRKLSRLASPLSIYLTTSSVTKEPDPSARTPQHNLLWNLISVQVASAVVARWHQASTKVR